MKTSFYCFTGFNLIASLVLGHAAFWIKDNTTAHNCAGSAVLCLMVGVIGVLICWHFEDNK